MEFDFNRNARARFTHWQPTATLAERVAASLAYLYGALFFGLVALMVGAIWRNQPEILVFAPVFLVSFVIPLEGMAGWVLRKLD